jgi:hypothetical protein
MNAYRSLVETIGLLTSICCASRYRSFVNTSGMLRWFSYSNLPFFLWDSEYNDASLIRYNKLTFHLFIRPVLTTWELTPHQSKILTVRAHFKVTLVLGDGISHCLNRRSDGRRYACPPLLLYFFLHRIESPRYPLANVCRSYRLVSKAWLTFLRNQKPFARDLELWYLLQPGAEQIPCTLQRPHVPRHNS